MKMPGEHSSYMDKLLPPLSSVTQSLGVYFKNFDVILQHLALNDKSTPRLEPGRSDFFVLQDEIMLPSQKSAVFSYLDQKFNFHKGFFVVTQNKVIVDNRDHELALLYNAGQIRQHIILTQKKLNEIIAEKGASMRLDSHQEKPLTSIEALQLLAQDDLHCFFQTHTSLFSLTPESMSLSKEFEQFEDEISKIVDDLIRYDSTARQYRYLFAFIRSVRDSHLLAISNYLEIARPSLQPPRAKGFKAARELVLPKAQPVFSALERLDANLIQIISDASYVAMAYDKFKKKETLAFSFSQNQNSFDAHVDSLRSKMATIVAQIKQQGSIGAGREDVLGYPLFRFLEMEKTIKAYESNRLHGMAKLLEKLKKEFSKLKNIERSDVDSMIANIVHSIDEKLIGGGLQYIIAFMTSKAISNCGPESFDFFMGMKKDLETTLEVNESLNLVIEKLMSYQKLFKAKFGVKLPWYNNSDHYLQILKITLDLFNEMELFEAIYVRQAAQASTSDMDSSGAAATATAFPPSVRLMDIHTNHSAYLSAAPNSLRQSMADKQMHKLLQTNPQLELASSDYHAISKHADAMLPMEYRTKHGILREKLTRVQTILAAVSQSKIRRFCSSYLTSDMFI